MASKGGVPYTPKHWTYGAEFEMADWDRRLELPPYVWAVDHDWTMVNSDGVAVDPRAELYPLGGEWCGSPSDDPGGLAGQVEAFTVTHPEASVNYRSNLHVHVRVPGLREDLAALKRVLQFGRDWLEDLLPLIEPIPEPTREEYPDLMEFAGARKRFARRKISHQTRIDAERVTLAQRARTPQEFFEAEALHVPSGRVLWATRPRAAVNLRQLLQTDTVEFRHFPGTTEAAEVEAAANWCRDYLELALNVTGDEGAVDPAGWWRDVYSGSPWPSFQPYVHWMEVRYLATSAHHAGADAARAEIARLRAAGETRA